MSRSNTHATALGDAATDALAAQFGGAHADPRLPEGASYWHTSPAAA
jgi:hypothetical protein